MNALINNILIGIALGLGVWIWVQDYSDTSIFVVDRASAPLCESAEILDADMEMLRSNSQSERQRGAALLAAQCRTALRGERLMGGVRPRQLLTTFLLGEHAIRVRYPDGTSTYYTALYFVGEP